MRTRIMTWLIIIAILLVIDVYVFQAVLVVSKGWTPVWRNAARYAFWIPTILSLLAIVYLYFGDPYRLSHTTRSLLITGVVAVYLSKVFAVIVLLIDDLVRGGKWLTRTFTPASTEKLPGEPISRSEFLSKAALITAAIPFGSMAYGVISGAHDYRIRRQTIYLPNLPKSFDGITIGQLSDIHSGSFFNKTAVRGGVEMFLREKPDVIFFTGDLVNNEASEVRDFINIFDKLKAPYGVYSVTGNHDYGDYKSWSSQEAKRNNFRDLVYAHKTMGFQILMNEHKIIREGGDEMAVIGNENWGGGRFAKYGRLDKAYEGTQDVPVKLLLSHDPSHWDTQVRPLYPDIDLMFAGHTHGFQFGVELGDIKWSPSQYMYKQWGGLYQEGSQYLYVNRGFGYLGYPGRVGMPPELTIITLRRSV